MNPTARHTQLDRACPITFLDKPEELLEKEKSLITEIYDASGLNDEEWEEMTLPAILNLAKFVQLLPASASHHHPEEGGLFRHSLETGLIALRIARNSVLSKVGTIGEINNARTYWNNAALLGGLYHDLGKTVSNFAVFNEADHSRWQPLEESLWNWGLRNHVKSYKVISLLSNDFADREDLFGTPEAKQVLASASRVDQHEQFSGILAPKLIPDSYVRWFKYVKTEDVLRVLLQSFQTNPNLYNEYLRKCIQEADRDSTSNYVRNHTDYPASETSGSIVNAFLSGVRYALYNNFWTVNRANSEVFVLENKCFIDWNRITLNNLAAFLEKNGRNPGFIRKKDELAEWLIDNHMAHANRKYSPDGKFSVTPYFPIQPSCLLLPTRAVWLSKSPFTGLVPSIDGIIQDCTDVMGEDAEDIFFSEVSVDQDKAKRVVSGARKIREEEETRIFNQSRSSTTERFDAEKEEKVRNLNKARREQGGRIRPIKTFSSFVDSVLKYFGFARFYEEDAQIVSETSEDKDLPVKREKNTAGPHTRAETVIVRGVSEEFAAKKVGYNRDDYLKSHPEVMQSEPLIYLEEGWKSYTKFPRLPRFVDSDFMSKEEKAEIEAGIDSAPSFSDFRSKKTNRFLWKYYPLAQKLAAFTSKENFEAITFADENRAVLLRVELEDFFKERLVPSEIIPSPVPVRVVSTDENGVVESGEEGEIQIRTPEIEKDGDVIAGYVRFYRRALENFKIGRNAGCFPPEFKDSEFYPFFVELAALFLNNVRCLSIEDSRPLPLVEVNKKSVRVNRWMFFTARFRSICRLSPQKYEDDPAYHLTTRVEKFLKPCVQVYRDSFRTSHKLSVKDKEEPIPSDFSVTFTDELTVAAVNFLIREHRPSVYRGDEESYFRNLFAVTGKGKAETAARQDGRFGREGMESYTSASNQKAEQSSACSQEALKTPEEVKASDKTNKANKANKANEANEVKTTDTVKTTSETAKAGKTVKTTKTIKASKQVKTAKSAEKNKKTGNIGNAGESSEAAKAEVQNPGTSETDVATTAESNSTVDSSGENNTADQSGRQKEQQAEQSSDDSDETGNAVNTINTVSRINTVNTVNTINTANAGTNSVLNVSNKSNVSDTYNNSDYSVGTESSKSFKSFNSSNSFKSSDFSDLFNSFDSSDKGEEGEEAETGQDEISGSNESEEKEENGENNGTNSSDSENNGSTLSSGVNLTDEQDVETAESSLKLSKLSKKITPQLKSDKKFDKKSDKSSDFADSAVDETVSDATSGVRSGAKPKPEEFLNQLADEILEGGGTLIGADDITFRCKKGMNMYCLPMSKFKKVLKQSGLDEQEVFPALSSCGRKYYFQGGSTLCLAEKPNDAKETSFW